MRLELKLRRVELDKSVLWTQPMVIPISPRLMSQQFELMLGEPFHDKSIGFCYIRESRALNSSSRVHSLSLSAVIFLHHPTLTVWDTETVSILQSPNLNYMCRTTKTAETETQSLMTLIQNGYLFSHTFITDGRRLLLSSSASLSFRQDLLLLGKTCTLKSSKLEWTINLNNFRKSELFPESCQRSRLSLEIYRGSDKLRNQHISKWECELLFPGGESHDHYQPIRG